jgi:hypothetical protein
LAYSKESKHIIMAMVPFVQVCPAQAIAETRTITVPHGADLPAGQYGFIEHYCDDLDCDCRRVLIVVWTSATGNQAWATINYGWESAKFYRKWVGRSEEDMKGPFLDPLGGQSPCAAALLEFFREMIEDEAYVARLKRHYAVFREALRAQRGGKKSARRPKSQARPRRKGRL